MKRVSSSAERRWIRPNQRQRRKAIPRHRTTWNLLLADRVPLIPPPLPTRWRAPTAVCYVTNAARSWDRAPPNTGHAREAQRRSTKRTPSRLPRPRMPNVENSAKGGQPPCLLNITDGVGRPVVATVSEVTEGQSTQLLEGWAPTAGSIRRFSATTNDQAPLSMRVQQRRKTRTADQVHLRRMAQFKIALHARHSLVEK